MESIDSMHSDWERGTFQCYATPTDGNDSMARRRMAIMHVSSIFFKNTLLFVRPLPTPTKYGTSEIVSLFRYNKNDSFSKELYLAHPAA